MKKILIILLLTSFVLYSKNIHWLGDYDKAFKIAKNEHKVLMVFLVKRECKSCNDIIKKVFMDKPYIQTLNKKVISVIVTYESKQNYPIEMYYSTTFPTLFFVNSKNEHFLTTPLYGKTINEKAIKDFLKRYGGEKE